jgi:hypothetical protein
LRKDNNRTDKILILIALILLIVASSLFYFDSWMWGGKRDRGDVIGLISKKSGDVRLKFEGELKWQRASGGDNLVYNDAVYAGAGSEAQNSCWHPLRYRKRIATLKALKQATGETKCKPPTQ